VDDAILWEKMGPIAGPYAEDTRLAFVLHIIDEYIHHGAEVALMRDLYHASQPQDPFVLACLLADRAQVDALRTANPNVLTETIASEPDLMVRASATGRWEAIPLLAQLGFPVNGTKGRGPLHHAAADGRVDLLRLLVEAGADLDAHDTHYNATPLQWAEYFSRTEAADYLRSVSTSAAR
jgi:ankyrin repeat protein